MNLGNKQVSKVVSVVSICMLIVFLGISPVFAIYFSTDFLEAGNSGGISGKKSLDSEWIITVGNTVDVDVWISGVSEPLLTAGLWVLFDDSLLRVENVTAFDNVDLPGPWDYLMTRKAANPRGPGHFFACGNLSGTFPDGCNDVLIVRITFDCIAPGDTQITITTIPGFDSVVGYSGKLFDPDFVWSPHTLFSRSPFGVILNNMLQFSEFPAILELPFCTITVK